MNPKRQEIIDKHLSKGRTEEEILFAFGNVGANESQLAEVESYIKKKSPSDSTVSSSGFSERPSVSESLSDENDKGFLPDMASRLLSGDYFIEKGSQREMDENSRKGYQSLSEDRQPLSTSPKYLAQQQKEIGRAAASDVFSSVILSKGNYEALQEDPRFEEAYGLFKNYSDSPAVKFLPDTLFKDGKLETSALPELQYGALLYANDYIEAEKQRKEELGSKTTIPVISELTSGGESLVGGILKFTELLGRKGGVAGELADFLLDDGQKRAQDALIDYGFSEEESSKSFIGNFQDGNVKAGFATLGSSLLSQVPQLIAVAYTGGAGLGLLGASAAGGQYAQVEDRDDLTANEKLVYSLGVGAIEYITEKIFLGDVNAIRRALGKELPKDASKKEIGDLMFGWLPPAIRQLSEEGVEEIIASSSQAVLGNFIAGDEIDPIEIVESGIIGALMGGGTYLAARGIGASKSAKDLEKGKKLKEYAANYRNEINKPGITAEEKAILTEALGKTEEAINDINSKYDQIAVKMTDEDLYQQQVLNNSLRKEKAKLKRLENPTAIKIQEARIVEVQDKITKLQEKYDDSKTGETPSAVEGQPVESSSVEKLTDQIYKDFIETGNVSEGVLSSIADKIILGEALTDQERAIYSEKGSEVENKVKQKQTEENIDVQESPAEKELRESKEDLILASLIEDNTFNAMDQGEEVEVSSIEKAQEKILKVIDDISNSDMDQESKDQYIETLERQFDKLENYDNKTITKTKTVTQRKKVTTPKIVNQRSKRKSVIAKRLQNVEVTTGKQNENQISVIEVQDDGSVDIVTYSKKTKKEVNRQKKAASSVSDLQYSESVFDDNGNLIGVKLKKKRINQDEAELEVEININTSRRSSKKNNELIFEIALEGMEESLGAVPTFDTRYEEVTREETTTEKVPSAKAQEVSDEVQEDTQEEVTEEVNEEVDEEVEEEVADDPAVEEPKIDEIFNDKEAKVKEAENKAKDTSLKGRLKTIYNNLKNLVVWNPAQRTIRMLKETLSGRLTNEGRRIKVYVQELVELIQLDEEAGDYVNKIFDGTITDAELKALLALKNGREIAIRASAMRAYIDSLSQSLVNDPAFQSLPEATRDAIAANIGSYVRGSYRFWKDKSYEPSEALINDAVEYEYNVLRGQAIASASKPINGVTRSQEEIDEILERDEPRLRENARRSIDEYLSEIRNARAGSDFRASGLIRTTGAKLPSKQFLNKKTLPETIEALLGKEKDPIIRFIDTTNALANIKYKGLFISEMLISADKDAIKDEITNLEESEGLYKKINDEFSPLNGKYVRADLFEVISDEALFTVANTNTLAGKALQGYFNTLILARKSKVIWNIPTWRKNLTGGWFTMLANGVLFNPNVIQDMINRSKVLLGTAKGKDLLDKETTEFLEIMGEYGLLGSSVDANFIGFMDITYGSANSGGISDGKLKTWLDKVGMSFKRFDKWSTENYSFVDDYTKLIIFRQEIPLTARKLYGKEFETLNDSEKAKVYRFAAERVKESTPTFSRLPRFYKSLAKMPFGDFLGFELEAIRSLGANIYNSIMDVRKGLTDKSLNSVQKSAYLTGGLKRMAGVASLLTLRLAIASGLAAMALGDDEELDEDVKNLRPDWMDGHSLIATNITKEGVVSVYDYSLEDPYGSVFDIGTSPQNAPRHIFELFGPNMAVEFIANIAKGKDVYGRDITENTDNVLKSAFKYGSYGAKQLVLPPFITSYYRDYIKKGEAKTPIDYFTGLASRTTIRDYRYDVGKQFYFNAEALKTGKKDFYDLDSSSKRMRMNSLNEIKKQYLSVVRIGQLKGNYNMVSSAYNVINRNFEPNERAFILYGRPLNR